MKKILKNKALFVSLLTFLFSLVCFATIGYAWVSIVKDATVNEFIGVVEDNTMEYQFSQIIDNNLVHKNDIQNENVMPGESNTFVLTVENRGNKISNVEVLFNKIFSEIDLGNGFTKDYDKRYKKLQYAYSYCVDLVAYVPDDVVIENIENTELVKIPTDDDIIRLGWIKIASSNNKTYFNLTNADGTDVENYPLIDNLIVNPKIENDHSVENKATVLIYFTIKFNSHPVFPSIIENVPEGLTFDGEYYANQRFNISNILIQGLD